MILFVPKRAKEEQTEKKLTQKANDQEKKRARNDAPYRKAAAWLLEVRYVVQEDEEEPEMPPCVFKNIFY